MNVVLDLGRYRKAAVWKDSFPLLPDKTEHELVTSLQLSEPVLSEHKKMAVELKLPKNSSYYALLGGEYAPNQTSEIIIKVRISNDFENSYNSGFELKEEIYLGIPNEYADSIINAAKEKILQSNWKYAGSVTFVLGAHSFIGSSEAIFSKVTKILISLMLNELCTDASSSYDSLIKEELDS